MLVEQAKSGHYPEKEPKTRIPAVQDAQDDGGAEHPENGLEGIHGEEIVEGQVDGCEEDQQRREELGKFAAARFASHPASQQNFGCGGKCGQEAEREQRLETFSRYQLSEPLVAAARPSALVMHCLPAHRGEEITDGVLDGPNSIVLDQAENRLHAQKAIVLELLGGNLDDV